jgi:hypothetical protein
MRKIRLNKWLYGKLAAETMLAIEVMMKKHFLAIGVCIILSGCAARVFTVSLTPPAVPSPDTLGKLVVVDARPDSQIYMTGISFDSSAHLYLLVSEPPLNVALQNFIEARASMRKPNLPFHSLEVSIERLDIKNKVGLAKADDLLCEIESRISGLNGTESFTDTVRTFSRNTENMSPLVTTSARVILQQCLDQHAEDILRKSMR